MLFRNDGSVPGVTMAFVVVWKNALIFQTFPMGYLEVKMPQCTFTDISNTERKQIWQNVITAKLEESDNELKGGPEISFLYI